MTSNTSPIGHMRNEFSILNGEYTRNLLNMRVFAPFLVASVRYYVARHRKERICVCKNKKTMANDVSSVYLAEFAVR
jgi:hypothetical protein